MKNILNTIVLLEIISVMCVRHTASFKNNYRGRPITKLFNTPQKNDNDSETPDRRPAAADGAKRSEFRRACPPAGAKSSSMHYIFAKLQKPRNRHYSALGALYLKVKVSKMEI